MAYIICNKRRGNPKINVEVCRRKCQFTEECEAYTNYLQAASLEDPVDVDSHATVRSHDKRADEAVRAA
jgi:hypothetical protein